MKINERVKVELAIFVIVFLFLFLFFWCNTVLILLCELFQLLASMPCISEKTSAC